MKYARKHRKIESYHWLLDVNYSKDDGRIVNRNAQIYLNIIKKSALGIMNNRYKQ